MTTVPTKTTRRPSVTGGDFGRAAAAVAVASVAAAVGPSAVGCGMLSSGLVAAAADGCGTEWVAAVWRPGPREAVDSSGCRASAARSGVCNEF